MSTTNRAQSFYYSWGYHPKPHDQEVVRLTSLKAALELPANGRSVLPFGLGRSYGDSCLNSSNAIIPCAGFDKFITFDSSSGILRAEAGVSLAAILHTFVPKGWFLPVSPGTKFVTLGGAIANDIHGKNHHVAGTFGRHVKRFELLRSTGERLICSPSENQALYAATIAGLGLTGLITWVEVQLIPIKSPYLDTRTTKFRNLDEFFDISRESDALFEYSVSWVDCTSQGANLGRGLFMAGNFSERTKPGRRPSLSIPFPCQAPSWLLNSLFMKSFNTLYYNKQISRVVEGLTHYEPFFYPLDAILNWNRMYGSRGFFQYQFVVPFEQDRGIIKEIFERITASKRASFLAVLKTFGDIPSPGMLSFPRKGVTLALDFPNDGAPTLDLMAELDSIVFQAGGCLYPAKDARMSPQAFRASYPRLAEFTPHIDPRFSSSLWRRVMELE
jgi:FAD/FMN-containing dehydrogenase